MITSQEAKQKLADFEDVLKNKISETIQELDKELQARTIAAINKRENHAHLYLMMNSGWLAGIPENAMNMFADALREYVEGYGYTVTICYNYMTSSFEFHWSWKEKEK